MVLGVSVFFIKSYELANVKELLEEPGFNAQTVFGEDVMTLEVVPDVIDEFGLLFGQYLRIEALAVFAFQGRFQAG